MYPLTLYDRVVDHAVCTLLSSLARCASLGASGGGFEKPSAWNLQRKAVQKCFHGLAMLAVPIIFFYDSFQNNIDMVLKAELIHLIILNVWNLQFGLFVKKLHQKVRYMLEKILDKIQVKKSKLYWFGAPLVLVITFWSPILRLSYVILMKNKYTFHFFLSFFLLFFLIFLYLFP